MLKGDRYIKKLINDISKLDTIYVSNAECILTAKYDYYKIEDKKSLESIIKFYNKYNDLIYSTKLKFIYIKNNLINIY